MIIKYFLEFLIAAVWLVNGLYCKVSGLVPRHEQIVSRILGAEHAHLFTVAIGIGEVLIGLMIFSSIRRREVAVFQIVLVTVMNIMEFFLVPDLLLFGRYNAVIAAGFISVVYFHGFVLDRKNA